MPTSLEYVRLEQRLALLALLNSLFGYGGPGSGSAVPGAPGTHDLREELCQPGRLPVPERQTCLRASTHRQAGPTYMICLGR